MRYTLGAASKGDYFFFFFFFSFTIAAPSALAALKASLAFQRGSVFSVTVDENQDTAV